MHFTLKMEPARSSEMLLSCHSTTVSQLEDLSLNLNDHENLSLTPGM